LHIYGEIPLTRPWPSDFKWVAACARAQQIWNNVTSPKQVMSEGNSGPVKRLTGTAAMALQLYFW